MSPHATFEDVLFGRARFSMENRNGLELLKLLDPGSVDHSIGDPPYDEKTHSSARSLKDGGKDIAIDFDPLPPCETFVPDLLRCTKRWVMQFCAQEQVSKYEIASGDVKFRREKSDRNYIRAQWWVRTNGAPQISGDRPAVPGESIVTMHSHRFTKKRWNGGGNRGYYLGPICDGPERLGHPTQKPEWLMEALIRNFTDPNDIVLDWCAGSGTTGAVCLKLGRRFIGCDLKGPCVLCGGDFPHEWEADLRRRVQSLDATLKPCGHNNVNYSAIALARLYKIDRGMKQQNLIAV